MQIKQNNSHPGHSNSLGRSIVQSARYRGGRRVVAASTATDEAPAEPSIIVHATAVKWIDCTLMVAVFDDHGVSDDGRGGC